jgi:hypothetical protein
MRGHVDIEDLAGRLETPIATLEAMVGVASIRVVEARGRRWLRLRDAGRIVMAIDPPDAPCWTLCPRRSAAR